ncbi:MAG: FapA family protein [Oscillospiraceae bacterium]|jgi:uncharacterized protein (DUF342 family)|nr:FapA family protein [Oscillospiraceae bacterium]
MKHKAESGRGGTLFSLYQKKSKGEKQPQQNVAESESEARRDENKVELFSQSDKKITAEEKFPQINASDSVESMESRHIELPFLQQFYDLWAQENGKEKRIVTPQSYLDISVALNEKIISVLLQLNSETKSVLEALKMTEKTEQELKVFGKASAFVSADKMSAWAFAFPPLNGGTPVTESDIHKALESAHITFGVDAEAVNRLTQPEHWMHLTRIAQGKKAQPGTDGRLEEVIPTTVGKPQVVSDHRTAEYDVVDYKDLNWLVHVKKDDLICRIIPATQGESGMNVQGAEIKGAPGKKPSVPSGKGTCVSEDGKTILAATDGQIFYENGKYRVTNVINIEKDVDLSTGNIDVEGNVFVHGNVRDGFQVRATGDVTISGSVGAGIVIAGKNLFVSRGINGNHQGRLHAGADVKCQYIENADVNAGGNVFSDSITNSTVVCDHKVQVESGRGVIVGGTIISMEGIYAREVGNQRGIATRLIVDKTPEFVEDKVQAQKDLDEVTSSIQTAEKQIGVLSPGADDPQIAQAIKSLNFHLSINRVKCEKLNDKMAEIQATEERIQNARIQINRLFPITAIRMNGFTRNFTNDDTNCLLFQSDEGLSVGHF